MLEIVDARTSPARIKVFGVGGGGSNAVNRMIEAGLAGVEFWVANTDLQALEKSDCPNRLQIGTAVTRGLGAGGDPEMGRMAAEEDREAILDILKGTDMLFLTAGMGGGTGTGGAPVVAEIAREGGILTVAIVTKPFVFEGKKKMNRADAGLAVLSRSVDTLITIPNQKLLSIVDPGTPFRAAMLVADEVLLQATRGISDLITGHGEINLDFADVKAVMRNRGNALLGCGSASGRDRAIESAQAAVSSPLLDEVNIFGAEALLINVQGGPDMTLHEAGEAAQFIAERVGEEADVYWGAVIDPDLREEMRVTLIATGFAGSSAPPSAPPPVRGDARAAAAGAAGAIARPDPFTVIGSPAAREEILSGEAVRPAVSSAWTAPVVQAAASSGPAEPAAAAADALRRTQPGNESTLRRSETPAAPEVGSPHAQPDVRLRAPGAPGARDEDHADREDRDGREDRSPESDSRVRAGSPPEDESAPSDTGARGVAGIAASFARFARSSFRPSPEAEEVTEGGPAGPNPDALRSAPEDSTAAAGAFTPPTLDDRSATRDVDRAAAQVTDRPSVPAAARPAVVADRPGQHAADRPATLPSGRPAVPGADRAAAPRGPEPGSPPRSGAPPVPEASWDVDGEPGSDIFLEIEENDPVAFGREPRPGKTWSRAPKREGNGFFERRDFSSSDSPLEPRLRRRHPLDEPAFMRLRMD